MVRNSFTVLAWMVAVVAALSTAAQAEPIVLALSAPTPPASVDGGCEWVTAPPVRLDTSSKYDQTTASKSVVDDAAYQARRQILGPIDAAIRRLEVMVATPMTAAASDPSIDCAARNLEAWAASGSLTDMATGDAMLTRDRFMASIAGLLVELKGRDRDLARQPAVRAWLQAVSEQTVDYYDRSAGPTSRRNNHRYWAGLSVGRIGYLLEDEPMLDWSRVSLDVGLCQVDREGFLPLELARGKKALDYHLFAFVALRSLNDVLSRDARVPGSSCPDGLARLQLRVEDGLATVGAFEARSGYRQDVPSRRNLIMTSRLSMQSRAIADLHSFVSY